MLRTTYAAESEIPENLKGAYVQRDGKWMLDELDEDHPVVKSKKQILIDKSTATARVEGLEADLATAKQSSLPRGHVAVAKADADIIEKLKAHGTAQEIETKLTEHATLKTEIEARKTQDHLREVAKILSYEPEAFVRLQNLPEFEIRDGSDGKKTVIAKVKGANNTVTEKPASEFIESSADLAPFLPALKAKGNGTTVHGTSSTGGSPPKDVFAKIREKAKQEQEQSQSDIHPMFRQIPGRVASQT